MAWLYGYYSEDPNYPEGVRVNVEAVYEPPQIGEINGVQTLDDLMQSKVAKNIVPFQSLTLVRNHVALNAYF